MIGRADIAAMIPHAGAMCLLDAVQDWDEAKLSASASSHRAMDNSLRKNGRLAAIYGVEYAAQAMAVHGRLSGGIDTAPRAGYLASLRDVICHVRYLDEQEGDLQIDITRLMSDEARVIYEFRLCPGGITLLEGRAAVILDAGLAA